MDPHVINTSDGFFLIPPRTQERVFLGDGSTANSQSLQSMLKIQAPTRKSRDSVVHINRLGSHNLFSPMTVLISKDDDEYLAKTPDLPQLYGCGETTIEAVEMLQDEILSLHEDLQSGDNFTDDWKTVKEFLQRFLEA